MTIYNTKHYKETQIPLSNLSILRGSLLNHRHRNVGLVDVDFINIWLAGNKL